MKMISSYPGDTADYNGFSIFHLTTDSGNSEMKILVHLLTLKFFNSKRKCFASAMWNVIVNISTVFDNKKNHYTWSVKWEQKL